MANVVRQQEDLLTVYLGVDKANDGPRLKAQLFRGPEKLSERLRLPLSQLGHTPPERSTRGHQMCFPNPQVPSDLGALFFEADQLANEEETIWLQIAYGADVLGAYPWEGLIGKELHRQLLRMPNFARNTYRNNTREDPIVICAATPVASGAPDWHPAVQKLLANFIFDDPILLYVADGQAHGAFDPDELLQTFPDLNISMAMPPTSMHAPARERFISDRKGITNPWLNWIAQDLANRFDGRAHAVHMFSGGYSQDTQGALALPQSPHQDDDQSWARFVGVPEFAAFADQVGCHITGLTALGDPQWREGLRLFANDLSWKRPGPIVLDQCDGGAAAAYNALLGWRNLRLIGEPTDLLFSVHPQSVVYGTSDVAVTRSAQSANTRRADFSDEMAYLETYSDFSSQQTRLPAELSRVLDRLSSAKPKSVLRSAQDRGTLNALKFLQTLPRRKDVK